MGKKWKQWQTLFLWAPKITADGDCSHEIKRHLLLGRKTMTSLSSVQSLSLVRPFVTPWIAAHQASLSITSQLLELAQIHVHWVGDAIQPSHPLSPLSLPAFSLSQHQGLFPRCQFSPSGGQWMGVSASASVLPMNVQDWFTLGWTGWISLQSKGLSRVFFNTTFQKHQFFGAQPSLWFNSHILSWPLEKP